jgi:cytochrome c oxidase cbb3-type subunit 3
MKKVIYLLVFLCSISVHAAPQGDKLYVTHCSSCHGMDGMGGVGVPLALPTFLNSVSDDFLKQTIRHGRPGRIMPSFPVLSDAQLGAIVSYIRGWSDKPAPPEDHTPIKGDAKHGEELFKKHCEQCHGKNGRGGVGTGVTLSRKRDLPIIAPGLNNQGFLAAASDVMIRDTIMFGREGTPMTSMLVAGLSEEDINDVVAYIRSWQSTDGSEPATEQADNEPPVITMESPYVLDETVENLKQAIIGQNFKLIRVDYLEHGLVEPGKENKKQIIVHFCNFDFLFKALAIDPRVGMFLPCRVTIIEKDGKVQLSTINPKRLSKLFNNQELDEACNEMYQVYHSLLEDATL